jgi:hypothetical protein
MADRSPLLNQMDRNPRVVMEDIYQKLENLRRQTQVASRAVAPVPPTSREMQLTQNIASVTRIEATTGGDSINKTDLNDKLQTLYGELELMRVGINSALNALRQLNRT